MKKEDENGRKTDHFTQFYAKQQIGASQIMIHALQ